jgi:hypothetical protein
MRMVGLLLRRRAVLSLLYLLSSCPCQQCWCAGSELVLHDAASSGLCRRPVCSLELLCTVFCERMVLCVACRRSLKVYSRLSGRVPRPWPLLLCCAHTCLGCYEALFRGLELQAPAHWQLLLVGLQFEPVGCFILEASASAHTADPRAGCVPCYSM